MFICLTCKSDESCINYTALQELGEKDFGFKCPTEGCNGALLQIDDGIAEALVALNDKGYTTEDSCAGHFNDAEGRILFYVAFKKDGSTTPPVDTLPEDFVLMQGYAIHYAGLLDEDEGDEFDPDTPRSHQLADLHRAFLDWVLRLPTKASVA